MKKEIIGSLLLAAMLFSGCSSKYPITYDSTPSGASVVCNGINHGYAPVTLYYEPDENSKKNGSIRTISCTANWISGARASYDNIWDLNKFPSGVRQTLPRPNVDGYDKDAQFALQVQQMYMNQKASNDKALNDLTRQMNETGLRMQEIYAPKNYNMNIYRY